MKNNKLSPAKSKNYISFLKSHWQIITLVSVFFLSYFLIGVVKHLHFQTFGWDLAIFDQLIFKWSRLQNSYSTVWEMENFSDHFNPILFLLLPFYFLKPSVNWLFFIQALMVATAAIPIYLAALRITKSQFFALALSFSFLLSLPLQYAVTSEFHEHTLSVFFISWIFYFIHSKENLGYWLSVLGLLLTKEEFSLLVVAVGLFLIFKKQYKKAAGTLVLGSFCFIFLVYFLMPKIGNMEYYYRFDFGKSGFSPQDILLRIIKNPTYLFEAFTDSPQKIRSMLDSFWPFGFLPLFSPSHFVLFFQQFAIRFLDYNRQYTRWTNFGPVGSPLMPILAYATITAVKNIRSRLRISAHKYYLWMGIILLVSAFSQDIYRHGPINTLGKLNFYQSEAWMFDNFEALQVIPKDVSVAATNTLVPHLSQREYIYVFPSIHQAEYLAFDLRDGPNKYSPSNYENTIAFKNELLASGRYQVYFQKNDALILKRK